MISMLPRPQIPNGRLLVIHPNYRQTIILRDALLQRDDIVYWPIRDVLDAASMLQGIADMLASWDRAPGAISPRFVVLDEADRLTDMALADVLRSLGTAYPRLTTVIFARSVPGCLVNEADLRRRVRFVPSDAYAMWPDYSHALNCAVIDVFAIGQTRVLVNGRAPKARTWPLDDVFYLLHYMADREVVSRKELLRTLWPDQDADEAATTFHKAKRNLRNRLALSMTQNFGTHYCIAPGVVLHYDVTQAEELIINSYTQSDTADRVSMLQRSLELLRGEYLGNVPRPPAWVLEKRRYVATLKAQALFELGLHFQKEGDVQAAIAYYLRATMADLTQEDYVEAVMPLMIRCGQQAEALQVYERLATALQREAQRPPRDSLRQLVARCRASLSP